MNGHGEAPADVDGALGALSLLVIYTEQLEACREFYAGLGLRLIQEQHGDGPVHYSTELAYGLVLEIYPAGPGRTTDRLRLGVTVPAGTGVPAGRELRRDPDGRVVDVTTVPGAPVDHETEVDRVAARVTDDFRETLDRLGRA